MSDHATEIDASLDTYDERVVFGTLFPLVSAYPTPEAIAAVMPASHRHHDSAVLRREVGSPPAGHALRRRTDDPWSAENTVIVPVPDELLAGHAAEVPDLIANPPERAVIVPAVYPLAPVEEYHRASLAILRQRVVDFDAIKWATVIADLHEQSIVLLIEGTTDWCAWNPMLRLAMALRESEDHIVLRAAEHRLRLIARRLLDAQGFSLVRVDDTLGNQPGLGRAVQAMLQR